MTARRKVLVAAGATLASLLAALIVLPVLFKDPVVRRVRAGVEGAVDARVDWGGFGITLFRDFPNPTVGLDDLTVAGVDRFEGDTLATVGSFRLSLDLGSVIRALRDRGPIVVRSVRVEEPILHLRVLEDGAANWDIVKERPAAETGAEPAGRSSRAVNVELRGLTVDDGTVVLDDQRSKTSAALRGVRLSLGGDFTRDRLVARTRAHADTATVVFAGVSYLDRATLDLDADLEVDTESGRVSFADNELRLNDLALSFSGEAARAGENLDLDITLDAPRLDFRSLLSLVPALYRRDFAALEAEGAVSLDGWVRGVWGEDAFPAFALSATVDGGSFRYPDLPRGVRNVSADLSIDNPGGDVDSTVVRVDRFHAELGEQPVDASLTLRTPVSDPDFDARVAGSLDLAEVARAVPLEDVEEMRGVVTADATVRARMSDIGAGRYERIVARGSASARGLTVRTANLPEPMTVEEAALELSAGRAELTSFRASIGQSDIRATGTVEDLLGVALRDEPLRARATVTSDHFDLDEWRSEEPGREVVPVPAGLELDLDATVDRLTYRDLEMTGARGRVRVRDRRATLEDLRGEMLGGGIVLGGYYETTDPSRPTFGVDLGLDSLDVSRASAALLTVRTLAPVARYARGAFSSQLRLDGALGQDMKPLFAALDGAGSVRTTTMVLQDFPLMERLAAALEIPRLRNPAIEALRSSVEIHDGRLFVRPFQVGVEGLSMNVAGSNGVDGSLDYTLGVVVPRTALGEAADRVMTDLVSRAGRAGLDLQAVDALEVGVRVTGTVTDPTVAPDFSGLVASTRGAVGRAAEAAVQRRAAEVEERVDSAREEARRRAQARADSIVREAEERAEQIREEARTLAERIRAEGDRRAEEVLAQATNPVGRAAAQLAADRIRQEANARADDVVEEADARADALVAEARERANTLVGGDGAPLPADTTDVTPALPDTGVVPLPPDTTRPTLPDTMGPPPPDTAGDGGGSGNR